MNISPDLYDYLTNFADDKTVLSMLSVNKKFNDDRFFKRVLERKYPYLLEFKKEEESYKQLYLRMIYAIAKLKEEYDIPYISSPNYNPYLTFHQRIPYFKRKYGNNLRYLYNEIGFFAAGAGNLNIIKQMIDKGANPADILSAAARTGHMDTVKNLIEESDHDYSDILNYAMAMAGQGGHLDIVKYLVSKGAIGFSELLYQGVYYKHCDIIEYAIEKGVSNEHIRIAKTYTYSDADIFECINNAVRKKREGN